RRMVTEFGMSPLGHISVGEGDIIGTELAARIDEATGTLVEEAYQRARAIVNARREAVAAIAEYLCRVETMDGSELDSWLVAYPADEGRLQAA
ncbi:MAG TPA: hypothetical protein VFE42_16685, partial [Chloroflexota bacterium]|nr:hypothetical protein [Chloroflexota bacterium]